MKTTITLLGLSLLFSLQILAQSPNWLWAKSAGASAAEEALAVTTDASGNCFVAGRFDSPTLALGSATLTNAGGGYDMFIVKYDAAGNVLWAKSAGGNNWDVANTVATDAIGNSIVAGNFESTDITFGSTTLTNAGTSDLFVVKYDAAGNVLWARSAGGNSQDQVNSVTTDATGNVIATGTFESANITFGSTTLTKSGGSDMFIVKYDAAGNVLWAKSAGASSYEFAYSVATDASGNSFVAGYFDSATLTFGSTTLTNAGDSDTFIVKYDANGNILWAKSAGGTGFDEIHSVTIDAAGNSIVAGYFLSATLTLGSTTLTNAGGFDMFIVKYDAAGNVAWANSAGGNDDDAANSVTTDAAGNTVVTGYFSSNAITFGSTTLNMVCCSDIFIVKYDVAGNVLWAKSVGDNFFDVANSITTDASGNFIVAGYFESSTLSFGSTTLTNTGSYDFFIAKLSGTTGIGEMVNDGMYFTIYPNPASNQLTIDHKQKEIESLEMYDLAGRNFYSHINKNPNSNSEIIVDVSKFPMGIYTIRIQAEEFTETKKVIIAE